MIIVITVKVTKCLYVYGPYVCSYILWLKKKSYLIIFQIRCKNIHHALRSKTNKFLSLSFFKKRKNVSAYNIMNFINFQAFSRTEKKEKMHFNQKSHVTKRWKFVSNFDEFCHKISLFFLLIYWIDHEGSFYKCKLKGRGAVF